MYGSEGNGGNVSYIQMYAIVFSEISFMNKLFCLVVRSVHCISEDCVDQLFLLPPPFFSRKFGLTRRGNTAVVTSNFFLV